MSVEKAELSPQLKALKTTDLSPMIRMAGVMAPRVLQSFMVNLDEKEKSAFDKVMPEGGEKKMYLQLKDTPTPPIVMGMAQPLAMSTMPENEVKEQQIRGVRLSVDDLQLLMGGLSAGALLRLVWRLRGQLFTILGISLMFSPLIRLGPKRLRNLMDKMTTHFKPLFDLLPRR